MMGGGGGEEVEAGRRGKADSEVRERNGPQKVG